MPRQCFSLSRMQLLLSVATALLWWPAQNARFDGRCFVGIAAAAQNVSCPNQAVVKCTNGDCVQSNFVQCSSVDCDNTGVETTTVGTCQSSVFDKSSVTCRAGACRSANVNGSTVHCTDETSCTDMTTWRSTVACDNGSCSGAHVYATAVTCEADGQTCLYGNVYLAPCSCCDGTLCLLGDVTLERCTSGNTLAFCSSTYLGKTCQEWGNPACNGLTVAPTGNEVAVCENGTCQGQAFAGTGVLCENRNGVDTCKTATFGDSIVDCNAGACVNAHFTNCTIQCFESQTIMRISGSSSGSAVGSTTPGSCHGATAVRSIVACTRRYSPSVIEPEWSCDNMNFYTSAVECGHEACGNAWFLQCSCCDGEGCPSSSYGGGLVASCTRLPVEFCSTLYAGKTCKEWGNPACRDAKVDETGRDVTVCTQGDCRQAVFTDAAVLCDNADYFGTEGYSTCQGIDVTRTILTCEAGACRNAKMSQSTITCQKTKGGPSCLDCSMSQSTVKCLDESCQGSTFVGSAVSCDSYSTCVDNTYDDCTCCDGQGCPYEVKSCRDDWTELCSSCAGRGNPVCQEEPGIGTGGSSPMDSPRSNGSNDATRHTNGVNTDALYWLIPLAIVVVGAIFWCGNCRGQRALVASSQPPAASGPTTPVAVHPPLSSQPPPPLPRPIPYPLPPHHHSVSSGEDPFSSRPALWSTLAVKDHPFSRIPERRGQPTTAPPIADAVLIEDKLHDFQDIDC